MRLELVRDVEIGDIGQTEDSKQTEGSNQYEGSKQTEGSGHCAFLSLLACTITAVICTVASLQYNTASGNDIIVLEGPIVIVFGLGVAIISCLVMCASALALSQACDVCHVCCMEAL